MKTPEWVVKQVIPHADHTMTVTFADGKVGVYDFKPMLQKKIFTHLNSIPAFLNAHVSGCTVAWDSETDIAPEHLYKSSIPPA